MAKQIKCIIKRRGHKQEYDNKKVYASIYSAALNTHMTEVEAEYIAETVTGKIDRWIHDKHFVESNDIKDQVHAYLKIINKDIALMYDTHLDIN